MAKKAHSETAEMAVSTFSKKQFLNSQRYRGQYDLLTAILDDDVQYSHAGIEAMINNFMEGQVK